MQNKNHNHGSILAGTYFIHKKIAQINNVFD